MKKKTRFIPLALVAALATSPFLTAVPKAYALALSDISPSSSKTGDESDYTFSIDLDKSLKKGDTITLQFPKQFDLDTDGSKNDITIDGDSIKKVSISNGSTKEIEITVDSDYSAGSIDIEINSIITNPDDEDDYTIKVQTSREDSTWKSKKVSIEDSGKNSSKDFGVSLSGKYTEDKTKITLGEFTLDDKLAEGDTVYVTFPTDDMLPRSISESDVEINGEEPKSVDIVSSSNQVKMKVPKKAAGTKKLELVFYESAGITLPAKAKSSYYFKVKYNSTSYDSESFEVKSGSGSSNNSSSSDFSVKLSDNSVGARSSYNFSLDLGKEKLTSGSSIEIEFPSSDMVPPIISASSVTINGDRVSSASSYGSKVYLKTPSSFKSSSTLNVIFDHDAYITNPKMPGSDYVVVARTGSQNIKSQKFTISGSFYTPTPTYPTTPATPINPVTPPVVVNNSTATVGLTKSALNATTGINIGIAGLGTPIVQNTDFIEVVMPVGFRVPTILNAAAVKVNGVQPSFVATRGQNLLVYPAQNLAAGIPVTVSVAESAGIATPTAKNVYSIGVYTSREKALLFARPISVGGAVIPVTQKPTAGIPASAARVKLNVAQFTVSGKSYPLSVAPYTLNGNTLVPAQFFKEALALTTQWNNQTCAIISGTTVIKFTIGSNKAKVGSTEVTLPVTIQAKNGMPMLPIKMIADTLKYKSGWDSATSSVYIYK